MRLGEGHSYELKFGGGEFASAVTSERSKNCLLAKGIYLGHSR